MIQYLSWSITNSFINNKTISKEDGDIYAFGFECIIATMIQIIVLLIVGIIFKCLIQIAFFTLAFTQIKKHIGGYHANSHFTCISSYTGMALISVYLCERMPIWISIILIAIAFFLILRFAPIQHYNNPKTVEEEKQSKKIALITSLLICICVLAISFSPFREYAIYGACGMFMSSLSLLVPNKL